MANLWALASLRSLAMMSADASKVLVLAIDLCRGLSFFEGAHVTADGEACFYGAVICEGVDLVFQCLDVGDECDLYFGGGEGGIGGADGAAGGRERGFLNSGRALIWFLPSVSVLNSDAVAVQFSEIFYRWGPFFVCWRCCSPT